MKETSGGGYGGSEELSTDTDIVVSKKSRTIKECIISFNNVAPDQEKVIVDFVMSSQRQFEINLGLTE